MMGNQNMSSSWDDTHPGKCNFLFTSSHGLRVLSVQQKSTITSLISTVTRLGQFTLTSRPFSTKKKSKFKMHPMGSITAPVLSCQQQWKAVLRCHHAVRKRRASLLWVRRASFVRSWQQPTRTDRGKKSSLSDLRQLFEWDLMFEWFFVETKTKQTPSQHRLKES